MESRAAGSQSRVQMRRQRHRWRFPPTPQHQPTGILVMLSLHPTIVSHGLLYPQVRHQTLEGSDRVTPTWSKTQQARLPLPLQGTSILSGPLQTAGSLPIGHAQFRQNLSLPPGPHNSFFKRAELLPLCLQVLPSSLTGRCWVLFLPLLSAAPKLHPVIKGKFVTYQQVPLLGLWHGEIFIYLLYFGMGPS